MSDISAILADLAAGRIEASEAERLIQAAGRPESVDSPIPSDEASGEWPAMPRADEAARWTWRDPPRETRVRAGKTKPVERVIVKATGRRVKVVADPTIKTAMAEDIHQTRRRSDTLEISGEAEQLSGIGSAISFIRSIRGMDDIKALGIGQELNVHINPELELDLDITGGSVTTSGVRRLGQVRLTAAVATLTDVTRVTDLLVQAGVTTVAGRFADGDSRLRVESGQLTLAVDPGSSATIHADSQIGLISWDTAAEHTEQELVVGEGQARLDLSVIVGQARVKLAARESPPSPR